MLQMSTFGPYFALPSNSGAAYAGLPHCVTQNSCIELLPSGLCATRTELLNPKSTDTNYTIHRGRLEDREGDCEDGYVHHWKTTNDPFPILLWCCVNQRKAMNFELQKFGISCFALLVHWPMYSILDEGKELVLPLRQRLLILSCSDVGRQRKWKSSTFLRKENNDIDIDHKWQVFSVSGKRDSSILYISLLNWHD